VVAFGDDAEDARATGTAFFHVAERLVLAGDVGSQGNDRGAFLQQGDRAVFQLGRVITLGVDVRDLLEFECAFEGDRIHRATADEERVFVLHIALRELGDVLVVGQHTLDQNRKVADVLGEADAIFAGCLCVDPRAPRCQAGPECDISAIQFSHCADPSLTCLVTLQITEGDKPSCTEAHCGMAVPTITTTSSTTTSSTSTSTSTTSTSTSTTSTTSTLPCVSTPSVSGCFEDLGNCTIRDNCSGLQWEKKQEQLGVHSVNNRYVWAGCCEDGCQTMCQPNAAASATCMAISGSSCTNSTVKASLPWLTKWLA